ncbi:cation diffusion facilitator family transporter [uncultured Ralstonia sp.]|uniref:cation diffusion facilitator family transporter n=2 Tax=Ralstonia TaxID=48736 RepID=UPI001EA464BA|nr:cation diffusion facilitator family transporter [uncultured Ralstonia sp.]UCF25157.1 MAG: cation transporter [Ralstonia sp.]
MSSTPPTIASAADRQQSAERSTIVSAGVNCVLSVCQIVAGMWSHSQGLVADGLHTLSDLIADGIVFIANRNSHKGPDEDHQYGHARYENAASLGLGLLLLAAGGGMIWTAVESLRSPHGPEAVHGLALWVALLALASKEGLFRYMLAVAKRIGSRMLIANAWHARSDAISSLVAAIGVAGNLMGLRWLDPIAACVVGLMIARVGLKFGWEALNDLMDRALPPSHVQAIRASLAATPGVLSVHDLRTRVTGDQALVDAHIEVDPRVSVSEGHAVAVRARASVLAVQSDMPVLDVQIHVDPRERAYTDPLHLPDRDAVAALLAEVLPHAGALDARDCVLHYVDGAVELDLILPAALSVEDAARLTAAVAARWGREVHVRVLVRS